MKAENFQINPSILFENIDGEVILINLELGLYFSLHKTAAVVWHLLEKKFATDEIISAFVTHYPANSQFIEKNIRDFLKQLLDAKLIKPNDSTQAEALDFNSIEKPSEFTPPLLETYADMKELLLIDPVHEVNEEGWPHHYTDIK